MKINGKTVTVPPAWRDGSLLTFLRDHLGMMGTKFGCGKGICGACTVHLDGVAARACSLPVSALGDAEVTTIEGLGAPGQWHPVQQAWLEEAVPQCGYCQTGQMMTAAALLARDASPTEATVTAEMNGNLCRCGTYPRIRRGVHRAAEIMRGRS